MPEPAHHRRQSGAAVGVLVNDLVAWISEGMQPTGIQRVASERLRTIGTGGDVRVVPVVIKSSIWAVALKEVPKQQLDWAGRSRANTTGTRVLALRMVKKVLPPTVRLRLRLAERSLRRLIGQLWPVLHGVKVDHLIVVGAFWQRGLPQQIQRLHGQGTDVRILVYDLIPIDHPEWFEGDYPKQFKDGLARVVPNASLVVTLIRDVADKLVAEFSVDRARVRVATPTLAASAARTSISAVPAPLILAPATVEPRKNHRLILDAWALAKSDPRLEDARLVVCGRRGWSTAALEQEMERDRTRLKIERIDRASDADLEELYASCRATVHASLQEGLGLPPRESIARGVPTLISTRIPRDGLPEGSYRLFEPDDAKALAALMLEVIVAGHARRAVELGPGTGWEPVISALLG